MKIDDIKFEIDNNGTIKAILSNKGFIDKQSVDTLLLYKILKQLERNRPSRPRGIGA